MSDFIDSGASRDDSPLLPILLQESDVSSSDRALRDCLGLKASDMDTLLFSEIWIQVTMRSVGFSQSVMSVEIMV